jgi:hypothetical protein
MDHGDEVIFLTDKEHLPEPTLPRYNDEIYAEIERKMIDYIQGEDFIVTTGSALPNVMVGVIIARMKGEHRFLKWGNRDHAYSLHTIRI